MRGTFFIVELSIPNFVIELRSGLGGVVPHSDREEGTSSVKERPRTYGTQVEGTSPC